MKWTCLPMVLLVMVEPRLRVECLCLLSTCQLVLKLFSFCQCCHLVHVLPDLFATPAVQSPIIIVLLGASNTKCAVDPTAAAEELSTTDFNPTAVCSYVRFSLNVPVIFSVEKLAPSSDV